MNRLIVTLIALTYFVLGCSREIPADPMCRTSAFYTEPDPATETKFATETDPAPAACLIKSNDKLLAIQSHDDEGWNLPHHKQQTSMSAKCTAHRAVWKSTGLNVG